MTLCKHAAFVGSVVVVSSAVLSGCGGGSNSPGDGGTGNPPPVAWKAAVGAYGTFAQTFDDVSWSTRTLSSASRARTL